MTEECGCYIAEKMNVGGFYGEEAWSTYSVNNSECKYAKVVEERNEMRKLIEDALMLWAIPEKATGWELRARKLGVYFDNIVNNLMKEIK